MIGFAPFLFQSATEDLGRPAGRVAGYSWSEMMSIFQEEQQLDEAVERAQHFRETLRQLRQDLLAGALQLDEAASQLEAASQANNRLFLTAIGHNFPGRPVREQLSLVLLTHLELDVELDMLIPEERHRVAHLREEYERSKGGVKVSNGI
jgi:hypothetical protein